MRAMSTAVAAEEEEVPVVPSTKPIILLEVDGVINMMNERSDKITNARKLWGDVKRGKSRAQGCELLFSPTVVHKLMEWGTKADVRWLTSWGRSALSLAPAMHMTSFPILPYDVGPYHRQYHRNHDIVLPTTKAGYMQRVLEEMGPDRLLIWVDPGMAQWLPVDKPLVEPDSSSDWSFLPDYTYRDGRTPRTASHMFRPNSLYLAPYCGLTAAHLQLIDRCLNSDLLAGKMAYRLDYDPAGRPEVVLPRFD